MWLTRKNRHGWSEETHVPDDRNPTATRMAKEAAHNHAATVQMIVDEVAAHAGSPPQRVKDALQDTWADSLPDHSPPLPDDKADEYAEHISAGRDIVVFPAERPLTSESGE